MVFHDFGDTIHLVLALVHSHYRIGSAHSVNFATLLFFRKYRPFSNAYRYLNIGCRHLRSDVTDLKPAFLNHDVEVGIDVPACNLISHLPFSFVNFLLLHLFAPLRPLAFHVRNIVKETILFHEAWLWLSLTRPYLRCRIVMIHAGLWLTLSLLWDLCLQGLGVRILSVEESIFIHSRRTLRLLHWIIVLALEHLMVAIPLVNVVLLLLQIRYHTRDMIHAFKSLLRKRETYHNASSSGPFSPSWSRTLAAPCFWAPQSHPQPASYLFDYFSLCSDSLLHVSNGLQRFWEWYQCIPRFFSA